MNYLTNISVKIRKKLRVMNTITLSLNNSVYSTNYQELLRLVNNDQLVGGGFNVDGYRYKQIFGTMVVRTSYKLTDEQQGRLTNSIITKLTEIKAD